MGKSPGAPCWDSGTGLAWAASRACGTHSPVDHKGQSDCRGGKGAGHQALLQQGGSRAGVAHCRGQHRGEDSAGGPVSGTAGHVRGAGEGAPGCRRGSGRTCAPTGHNGDTRGAGGLGQAILFPREPRGSWGAAQTGDAADTLSIFCRCVLTCVHARDSQPQTAGVNSPGGSRPTVSSEDSSLRERKPRVVIRGAGHGLGPAPSAPQHTAWPQTRGQQTLRWDS